MNVDTLFSGSNGHVGERAHKSEHDEPVREHLLRCQLESQGLRLKTRRPCLIQCDAYLGADDLGRHK